MFPSLILLYLFAIGLSDKDHSFSVIAVSVVVLVSVCPLRNACPSVRPDPQCSYRTVNFCLSTQRKWNESGFRPPLCTYRLNWARRTSWGWWDDWDDTVLQTQDSKFKPWRSEAEHATSRSRRLPTILTFTRGWGRNNFVSFKPPRPGTEPRTLAWKAAVLTTTLGPPPSTQRCLPANTRRWSDVDCMVSETLGRCRFNVGPSSSTLALH